MYVQTVFWLKTKELSILNRIWPCQNKFMCQPNQYSSGSCVIWQLINALCHILSFSFICTAYIHLLTAFSPSDVEWGSWQGWIAVWSFRGPKWPYIGRGILGSFNEMLASVMGRRDYRDLGLAPWALCCHRDYCSWDTHRLWMQHEW